MTGRVESQKMTVKKEKQKKKKNNNNNLKKKVRQWYGVDYIFKNVLLLLKKDCSAPRR